MSKIKLIPVSKVFLAAIAGYLPSSMVQCVAVFMDACYVARRNAITAPALKHFHSCVERFHKLRNIFIEAGVRASISLPRQHALSHYYYAIQLFGSPNGVCSSITESKHIKAVKEPWRRSSRFRALIQMLQILVRMDKMAALHRIFSRLGMLTGSTSSYMVGLKPKGEGGFHSTEEMPVEIETEEDDEKDESGATPGSPSGALSDVKLAVRHRTS